MGLILGTQQLAANVTQTLPDHGFRRSPIKVALLSLPPRTHSLLEFFFTNAGRGSFVASGEDQAETAIFDLDTPASREHWGSYNARTGRPGIALAVKQQEVVGALWVQKPVTPAALLAAAAALRARDFAAPTPAPLTVPVPEPLTQSRAQDASMPAAPSLPAREPASAAPSEISALERSTVTPSPAETAAQVAAQTSTLADAMMTPSAGPSQDGAGVTAHGGPVVDAPANPGQTATRDPQPAGPGGGSPAIDLAVGSTSDATVAAKRSSVEEGKGLRSFWKRVFGTPDRAHPPVDLPSAKPAPADSDAANQTAEAAPQAAPTADPLPSTEPAGPGLEHAKDAAHQKVSAATDAPGAASVLPDLRADSAQDAAGQPARAKSGSAMSSHESDALDTGVTHPESKPSGPRFPEPPVAPAQETTEKHEPAVSRADAHHAATPTRHAAVAAAAPEQQATLFGTRDDVSAKDLAESAELRYDPEQHLVGALREAFLVATKWQVPTQIDCGGGFIVVNAERNELHASLDETGLQELSSTPLTRRSKVQTLTNLEYVQFKQSLEDGGKGHVHRLDDTLWKAALWSSAGRLPKGAQPGRTLYLRQWPNLTRIKPVPQGARLAAMWALRGASVLDSCKQFSLPQRQVIGFYNGVWALNLLTDDSSLAQRATRKGARNRGLLTRLLGWLRR